MERNEELNLVDAIAVLRRRWWVVLAVAAMCGATSFLYFRQQTPRYAAQSVILIDVRTAARISAAAGQGTSYDDPKRILADQVELAKSESVRTEVRNRLGGEINVDVSGREDANIVLVTAKDESPIRAADMANTYVTVHQQFSADRAAQAYADALASIDAVLVPLQQRLAELAPLTDAGALNPAAAITAGVDPTLLAERLRLQNELAVLSTKRNAVLVSAGIDKDVVTKVISQASVPEVPFSPRTKRNAVLGVLAGLVMGLAGVFLRDYLDDRLRDRASITKALPKQPVLATVPQDWRAARAKGSLAAEGGAVGEAVRGLRTSVQFAGLTQPMRSVLVTSSRPKEGKSTIAASLAVALAHSGTPTVLVDADLRKPRVHKVFGLTDNGVGLSSVLQGRSALSAALRDAPGVSNLLVLTAGPSVANAADLLWPGGAAGSTITMQAIVDELVRAGYQVVVDAPPVLPVADALTISRAVDGVVYVLAAGQARERDVTRAFELLAQAGANVIGVAVNKLSRGAGGYGGYGYGYGDSGRSGRSAATPAPVAADSQAQLSLVDLRAAVGASTQPPGGAAPQAASGGSPLHNPLSGNGSA